MAPNAVNQPDAMVVVARNACFAEVAVFTPRWFEVMACTTALSLMKDDTVIRITLHLLCVVLGRDIRVGDRGRVQKNVRGDCNAWDERVMVWRDPRPDNREK